jgi:hypothetical protein
MVLDVFVPELVFLEKREYQPSLLWILYTFAAPSGIVLATSFFDG